MAGSCATTGRRFDSDTTTVNSPSPVPAFEARLLSLY